MKTYKFKINDEKYKARILEYKGDKVRVDVNGIEYLVELEAESTTSPALVRSEKIKTDITAVPVKPSPVNKGVNAPIPGLVHAILLKVGDPVNEGDAVLILEAMKMESEITANKTGKILKILVKEGETVQEGQSLFEIGE